MNKRVIIITAAVALIHSCVEPNPKFCDTDAVCQQRATSGDPSAVGNTLCHPLAHFCYAGCKSDADCQVAGSDGYHPDYKYCNQTTHHCEKSAVTGAALGATCGGDTDCQSGHCVNEICCSAACGECEQCNASGACEALADGPAPEGKCAGDASCGAGQCKSGKCAYLAESAVCASSCSAGTETASHCDAQHLCKAAEPKACTPYQCDAEGKQCATKCITHGDCVNESLCDRTQAHVTGAGTCVAASDIVTVTSQLTLQNAINVGKRYVKVPAANYDASAIIKDQEVTIVGMTNGVMINPTGTNPGFDISGAANVTLQSIKVASASDNSGIYCNGGSSANSALTVIESTLESNGGLGIEASKCNVTVHRSRFNNNSGGGLSASNGNITITNSLFLSNGLAPGDNPNRPNGSAVGGLQLNPGTGSVVFSNNTVVKNHVQSGVPGGSSCTNKNIKITNTVIWDNDNAELQSNACTFQSSIVEPETDPGLDPVNNYRPKSTATSILDKGTATPAAGLLDLLNNSRTRGSAIDIGAYEVQ